MVHAWKASGGFQVFSSVVVNLSSSGQEAGSALLNPG